MSVIACEYVRLFYHVFKGNSPSTSSKKYTKVEDCYRLSLVSSISVIFLFDRKPNEDGSY